VYACKVSFSLFLPWLKLDRSRRYSYASTYPSHNLTRERRLYFVLLGHISALGRRSDPSRRRLDFAGRKCP